jgi:hypothetical protein
MSKRMKRVKRHGRARRARFAGTPAEHEAIAVERGAATSYGEALGHGSHPLSADSKAVLNRAGSLLSDAGEKLYAKCIVKR